MSSSSSCNPSNPSFKQPYQAPEFKIDTSKLKFAPKAPPSLVSKTASVSIHAPPTVNLKPVKLPCMTFSPPINTLKPIPKLNAPTSSIEIVAKIDREKILRNLSKPEGWMHAEEAYATKEMMSDLRGCLKIRLITL